MANEYCYNNNNIIRVIAIQEVFIDFVASRKFVYNFELSISDQ